MTRDSHGGDTDDGAPEPPESTSNESPAAAPKLPTIRKPSAEHGQKVQRVRELFYRARAHRQPIIDQWVRNYEILHNRAWAPGRPSHLPSPSPAELWPIVNSITAWESDSAPAFDVIPAADPNSDTYMMQWKVAQDLRTTLRAAQVSNDYDEEIQKFLWDGNVYGIGILKTLWDSSRHMGLGDATLIRVDPFNFYPDPDATCMKDAQFVIEAQELNDDQLEVRFPGALDAVGTSAGVDEHDRAPTLLDTPQGSAPKVNPGPMAGVANEGYGLPGQSRRGRMGEEDVDSDRHLVLECWWQRATSEGQRWWVTVICGNAVLLEVPATDLWGHGDQPYDRWVPVETGEFWSPSLVEILTPLQRSINKMLAAIENNIDLAGNPVMLEDIRAGLSRSRIINRPGQRLPVNANAEVKWLDPPQMHPQIAMQLIDFYVGEMERISGLSAIVRGATPTGRNSEGVIGSMQEAAFVRIRMALRNLEHTLRRQGNKTAALIAEFYDTERVVSFLGPSGEQTAAALRGKHFYVPDPNSDSPSPIRFALHVQAGSSISTSRSHRSAEADTLFAMGAIDEEAVLQAHEFPNWPLVVARVREKQAAMMGQGADPMAGQGGEVPSIAPPAREAAGRTH